MNLFLADALCFFVTYESVYFFEFIDSAFFSLPAVFFFIRQRVFVSAPMRFFNRGFVCVVFPLGRRDRFYCGQCICLIWSARFVFIGRPVCFCIVSVCVLLLLLCVLMFNCVCLLIH